jgi:hypothetical protein
MEPEGLSPHSQKPATFSCPEADQSNPRHPSQFFFKDPFKHPSVYA